MRFSPLSVAVVACNWWLPLVLVVTLIGCTSAVVTADHPVGSPQSATYYVRSDGGSSDQCTGLSDSPYSGNGLAQPCAWDHPFRALPPDGAPRITGGDTLIIGKGEYMMGYGAPGTENCSSDYPYNCHITPIPSGPDASHPTRILGAGWDAVCSNPPELWGAERAYYVLNLTDSDNVEIACLEITDHSGCVEFHSGGLTCERDSYPYGPWASTGLYAEDSANVHLQDLNIHGLAHSGVWAGRLNDWTVENVRVAGNGWVGWDGDIDGGDSNTGVMHFSGWTVEWNGCGETYPGGEPAGCWGQTAGGYGDGVGTGATGGHWIIEDSAFLHNTSDGLDLLYIQADGQVEIRRTIAEGNAGNQIKTSGPTTIENTIAVGNCGFFDGQTFTYNVDNCRALGNAVSLNLYPGDQTIIANNTISSEGDCLLITGCDGTCDGSESILLRNNIFQGHSDFLQPHENTCLVYAEDFPQDPFDLDYNLIADVKNNLCPVGTHDICDTPDLADPAIDSFDAHLLLGSPAIDTGSTIHAPIHDFDNLPRDATPDIGAYEHRPIDQDIHLYLNQILLNWVDIVGPGHHYQINGSHWPYFEPGDPNSDVLESNLKPPGVGESTSFTDTGHSTGDTYYYLNQAISEPGQVMALSNRTGIISFPLILNESPTTQLIQPDDLTYLGAFRLPDGPPDFNWEWSGAAMAYYPDGDPDGPGDGFPGSIFGTGHNWNQYVSEVNIPVPVISPSKNLNDLNTASTLQGFQDIRGNLFPAFEIPRTGLAYLPAQGDQSTGKLHFCWAQHMGEGETNPSHGWSELNLSNPQTAGAWRIGDHWNYVTTDYLFGIPQAWSDANTPGMRLATGRFRDGGQGAQGPSLFAYGPWNEGNPPAPDSTLPTVPVLLYTTVTASDQHTLSDYHHSDEWSGGAWLTAGDKAAVVFIGTKGVGNCWYGCADGTVWPDEPPYPPECPERGWWSTGFWGELLFYDPTDLAAVANGRMEAYQPQPYATLNIDEYLYHIVSDQQKHHVGAASFDRNRGLLYVFEPLADRDKSLVHVWRATP